MQDLKERLIYHSIRKAVINKGYKFFDNGQFNLNIIGIRRDVNENNLFDDLLTVLYLDANSTQHIEIFNITTDPGRYWLKNPMTPTGTAILKEGQYRGAYILGKHRGKYEALVQNLPVEVYRDNDKNEVVNYGSTTTEKGHFGINIHRSNPKGSSYLVDRWSAGCQVFKGYFQYMRFMKLVNLSAKRWSNRFTYTLINEKDLI